MNVAITGATGFLGRFTLDRLVEAEHRVRALTRRPQPARDRVEWVGGSLDDEPALARLCRDVDAVVHIAGVTNAPDAAAFDAGNRAGTAAVLEAALAGSSGCRFIHVSSLAARAPTLSNYGASKRAGEDAVTASALDWRVLRPPGIYGPGELVDVFKMAKSGVMIMPLAGRASWIHVDDTARLLVAMLDDAVSHTIYEADDGCSGGWSHADFARAVGSAVGRRVVPLSLPAPMLHAAARLDGLLRGKRAALTTDRVNYMVHPDWTIDPARRPPPGLWVPAIETRAGLAATAAWYRASGAL